MCNRHGGSKTERDPNHVLFSSYIYTHKSIARPANFDHANPREEYIKHARNERQKKEYQKAMHSQNERQTRTLA